jgi:hypothetical protein
LEELVSGLLRPKLFPFGKLSKAKPAAQLGLRKVVLGRQIKSRSCSKNI